MNTRRTQANISTITFTALRYSIAFLAGLLMLGHVSLSFAQVGPDAGALQQQLQRQCQQQRRQPYNHPIQQSRQSHQIHHHHRRLLKQLVLQIEN
jgi:hypothetical protein